MKLETLFEKFDEFADTPNGVKSMRELVLRLAFSGGLTGNRPTDDGVPDGWESRTIESISASISSGFACSRSHQVENGHVHLRTHNISTLGTLNFDLLVRIDPRMVDPQKASIRAGDILFNNTNSQELVGKTSLVDRDYNYGFSNHITRIRLRDGIFPGFVVYYLTLLRNSGHFARLCTRWINQAAINTDTLKEQTIPLPPLAEQKRIVAKVDELMALCDRLEAQQQERKTRHAALARASLERFTEAPTPANLQLLFHPSYSIPPADLRKSILTLAVQGKLVPQDPNDEPAEELIARLERDRARLATQHGVRSPKSVPPLVAESYPHDVPESWRWSRIGRLALVIDYGTSHKAESDSSKVPVYRMGNIVGGRLVDENLKYVDASIDGLPGLYLKTDDILFNRTNSYELVGKAGIFTGEDDTATFASYLIRIRLPSTLLLPAFYSVAMNAPYFRRTQIEPEIVQQCGQANFNGTKLASTVVPVPPLAEQQRIVAKVNQLLAFVDQLEAQLATSATLSASLLESAIHALVDPRRNVVAVQKAKSVAPSDRAAIGCYAVRRMADRRHFGRTAEMKLLYLAEAHLGLALGGKPMREAAGPFDQWIYRFEKEGAREGWFQAVDRETATGGKKVEYRPGPALEAKAALVSSVLTVDQQREFDRLLNLFTDKTTEQAEIIATLFAAWNDFLIDGRVPTDDDIIREVRENWHPTKARFSPAKLAIWLAWLRSNSLIPKGHPPRTVSQAKLSLH